MAAAMLTPVFMGFTPVFGKLAMLAGLDAYTLSAMRTGLAALVMWVVYLLFFRKYTFIFTAGLLGTLAVGVVNGLGSLLFYNGLQLLNNASLAQLLNMTYAIFAMLLTRIYGQRISWKSALRAVLAFGGVYLLTAAHDTTAAFHWLGVGLMLGAGFMYALHVILSQRVMYEMPAPTMALYGMTFMSLSLLIVRLVAGAAVPLAWAPADPAGWWFVVGLAAVTALSRVTLFAGVRGLGGVQAILLNMAEVGVTLLAGFFWLGERMTPVQWIGVAILSASVLLAPWDDASRAEETAPQPLQRPAAQESAPTAAPASSRQS